MSIENQNPPELPLTLLEVMGTTTVNGNLVNSASFLIMDAQGLLYAVQAATEQVLAVQEEDMPGSADEALEPVWVMPEPMTLERLAAMVLYAAHDHLNMLVLQDLQE